MKTKDNKIKTTKETSTTDEAEPEAEEAARDDNRVSNINKNVRI